MNLENVFKDILSKEEIEKLKEELNKKIEEKAKLIAEDEIAKVKEEYNKKVEEFEQFKKNINDTLDDFIEKIITDIEDELNNQIDYEIEKEELKTMVEAFKLTMSIGGNEVAELIKKGDKYFEQTNYEKELEELKKENFELYKIGLVYEYSKDLSEVERDKFLNYVKENIPFDDDIKNLPTKVKKVKEMFFKKNVTSMENPPKSIIVESKKQKKAIDIDAILDVLK